MRNLNTYEQWLNESNKAVEYFRAHPEELSKYANGIQPHHKQEYKVDQAISGYSDPEWPAKEKIFKAARMKLTKIGGEVIAFEVGRARWTYTNMLLGQGPEDYSGGWYDSEYFKKAIMESKTFEDFLEAADSKKRFFRYPFEDYNKKIEPNEEPLVSIYRWMKNHYKEIQDFCKWLDVALAGIKRLGYKKAEKEFMKIGLSTNDVKVAMTYIKEWTSMSRKKLDPSVWELLNKISVDEKLLPQYVYRGIFYDGAKIKDPVKWKEKWYPGSQPGVSQGKATSWTIDRKTAMGFMTDQDFIKDRDNGYYMLLKWKVDPKLVIADLRNLPVDHTFWNQQEIIVSPEAKDYEVDSMVPGTEGYEGLKKFQNESPGGQGAYGQTKSDFALSFMSSPYETLSPGTRMEFKQISKMTLGEYRKSYPNSRITADAQWNNVSMALYNYATKYCSNILFLSTSRDEIKFNVSYDLRGLDYSQNPNIKSMYTKYYDEMKFNQFAGVKEIVSNVGSIKLIDDDYYDMDIQVNLPTSFSIQNRDGKTSDRDIDIQADLALEKIFKELGEKPFIDAFKMTQLENQKRLPKNIQVDIK
jgi:hypothetical protein